MMPVRIAVILAILAGLAAAQSSPEFEVASVKPAGSARLQGVLTGGPGTSDPTRISSGSIDLRRLLMKAYGVETNQISAPGWFDSEKYAIAAKIPPGTTQEQFQIMLQNLLTERFKITLHHEARELPVYELSVAKGGPKLTQAAARDVNDLGGNPQPGPVSMQLDKEGCP